MHWLQHHWYRITLLHVLLFPLSLVFRMLVALRRELYRNGMLASHQLLVPVIVAGNISAGGSGKTPLTLALARKLVEHGWHPVIVSRGYGRAASLPAQVDSSGGSAAQAGDEPLMMAQRDICPVWVGVDRVATAQAALQHHPQCDVVICDDGLQHYRLRRDVEIAVVDGVLRHGNGWMLPAGPLREPVSRLKTVDAVVVNGDGAHSGEYAMQLAGEIFYNLCDPEKKAVAADFHHTRNHAVAGIGHPQRYFKHLETLCVPFTAHIFPDHHPYLASDLSFTDCDAILLTEKDAVKCTAFADERYWVLRVDARIDAALLEHILMKIKSHGSQTA